MTNSIEAENLNENEAILKELDDLMDYMGEDIVPNNAVSHSEELIDPSFFIGEMQNAVADVPTLTSVAEEMPKQKEASEDTRQPGLFSSRVAEIKKNMEEESQLKQSKEDDIRKAVDDVIEQYRPIIEEQLRARISDILNTKK